ncbi:MAG: hypothetical protein WC584_02910 [Candidatus Pacearchaeota archaeon]
MSSKIYSPAEDSYLMQKVLKEKIPIFLKENHNLKVLEIGAGSGIQLVVLQQLGVKNIFSSDINPNAVMQCKRIGFNCTESDLFENIWDFMRFPSEAVEEIAKPRREGRLSEGNRRCPRYDLIIFNPPYLPEDKRELQESKIATTGGKNGSEIINNFLIQAKSCLNKNGKIFLLTSSMTKKINWQDYNKIKIAEDNLFMERLFVWEVWI